jgi:vacuolar-type H+-ATPase subunit H
MLMLIPGRRMKHKRGQQDLTSLIPSVRNSEQHLDELLVESHARAERTVSDARTRADQLIREAQAELPGVLAAEREAELRLLRQGADRAARAEQERTESLTRAARGAVEAAVAFVVGLIWPGGRP